MRRYEVVPSAGRFQVVIIEDGQMTRLWPRHDTEEEATADMSARVRRDRTILQAVDQALLSAGRHR